MSKDISSVESRAGINFFDLVSKMPPPPPPLPPASLPTSSSANVDPLPYGTSSRSEVEVKNSNDDFAKYSSSSKSYGKSASINAWTHSASSSHSMEHSETFYEPREYLQSTYKYASFDNNYYSHSHGHRYPSTSSRTRSEHYSRSSPYTKSNRYECKLGSISDNNEKRSRTREDRPPKTETERDRLLRMWRSNYCETPEDIQRKMEELAEMDEDSREVWIRSSPADPYYRRTNMQEVEGSARLDILCHLFDEELLKRAERIRDKLPPYKPAPRQTRRRVCKHKSEGCSSSDSDSSDNEEFKLEQDNCMEELSRKVQHPHRIHADLWHNEPGEMNDGPLCRCSLKSRRVGIRHGIYPGETGYAKCDPNSNNANKLHHYRITISPPTNFLTKTPTIIKHDEHEFLFEGFSLLSHFPLGDLPTCKVIRFNIEYTILYVPEKMPENFTVKELDLFCK